MMKKARTCVSPGSRTSSSSAMARPEHHAHRHEPDREHRRHDQRVAAAGAEHGPVVGQPGEAQVGAEDVAAVQAALEHQDQRQHREDHGERQHRQARTRTPCPSAGYAGSARASGRAPQPGRWNCAGGSAGARPSRNRIRWRWPGCLRRPPWPAPGPGVRCCSGRVVDLGGQVQRDGRVGRHRRPGVPGVELGGEDLCRSAGWRISFLTAAAELGGRAGQAAADAVR